MFYLFVQRKFHNLNHVLCMILFFLPFIPLTFLRSPFPLNLFRGENFI